MQFFVSWSARTNTRKIEEGLLVHVDQNQVAWGEVELVHVDQLRGRGRNRCRVTIGRTRFVAGGIALRLVIAMTLSLLATIAVAQGLPPPSFPDASLDLAPSDISTVRFVDGGVSILLKKPAAERLRQVTAATVGGKVTLTLDGTLMLKTWVSGEIDNGHVFLKDVKEPMLARLKGLERQLAAESATQK